MVIWSSLWPVAPSEIVSEPWLKLDESMSPRLASGAIAVPGAFSVKFSVVLIPAFAGPLSEA
jgi:hypothetical protein